MSKHLDNSGAKAPIVNLIRATLLTGVCATALAAPALAQDAMETVVVTGIRGSLQRSLDVKRESVGIVDAISSEDIGKFPDTNLATAMMRIPGITVSRGRGTASGGTGGTTSNGEANQVTVRGFGPQFNETLFDGRMVASGTGNRSFDFSSVGSDFVGQIAVLKTPDATLSAGAIGATINVKMPKPFDHPGLVVSGSFSGNISPERGKWSPNGSFLLSDTFANDTFGILVAGTYTQINTRMNHVNTQGWEGKTVVDPATDSTHSNFWQSQFAGTPPALGQPVWFIQDYGIYREIQQVERMQGRVVLQWRPTDNIQVTLNDNYSRDNDHQAQYGYSVWFNNGSLSNVKIDKNGTIVDFRQQTPTDFQGQYNPQILQFNDIGANVVWNVSDKFTLTLDADHAEGWSNPGHVVGADMDVGYGNAASGCAVVVTGGPLAPGNCNTIMGIAVPDGHGIPYPTSYGPNNDTSQFINNGIIGSHVLPLTQGWALDTVNQAKILGEWVDSDALSIRFGFQYVAEHLNQDSWDSFQNSNWQAYAGYGPASGNAPPNGVALPQNLFAKSFSTADFINGWSGAEKLPAGILQYDPWPTVNYLNGLNGAGANYGCCTPNGSGDAGRPFSGTYQVAFNPGSHHVTEEKTYSGFIEATFKTTLAAMPLKVNFGTRYDITQEHVTGLGRIVTGFKQFSTDLTAWDVQYQTVNGQQLLPVSKDNSYQYLLPNIDMTLSVTDSLDLRFNASRTLTRPPIANLNPVTSVGGRVGAVTVTGGNPDLLPFVSDNLDVGAQWYYASNSYLSFDTFLKSVSNFVIQSSRGGDFGNIGTMLGDPTTKVLYPTPVTGVDVPYTITQPSNGPSANVYGLEIAWQHVFGDSGFGYLINGTIVGTNKPYNPLDRNVSGFAMPGLADSANFMVFYDKDGFQARLAANWQDTVLDHFGQIQNNSSFGSEPTFVNTSWNLDFSTSYDVTEQLTVYFSAQNLTNATYSTHGRYSNQLLDVVDYGRKFITGVHFKL